MGECAVYYNAEDCQGKCLVVLCRSRLTLPLLVWKEPKAELDPVEEDDDSKSVPPKPEELEPEAGNDDEVQLALAGEEDDLASHSSDNDDAEEQVSNDDTDDPVADDAKLATESTGNSGPAQDNIVTIELPDPDPLDSVDVEEEQKQKAHDELVQS